MPANSRWTTLGSIQLIEAIHRHGLRWDSVSAELSSAIVGISPKDCEEHYKSLVCQNSGNADLSQLLVHALQLRVEELLRLLAQNQDRYRTIKNQTQSASLLNPVDQSSQEKTQELPSTQDVSEQQASIGQKRPSPAPSDAGNTNNSDSFNSSHHSSTNKRFRLLSPDIVAGSEGISEGDNSEDGADPQKRQERTWRKLIMMIWQNIQNHKYGNVFLKLTFPKNDPAERERYFSIIKQPMDLQTVKTRVKDGLCRTTSDFHRDILLIFTNAMMYHSDDSETYRMAKEILVAAESEIRNHKRNEAIARERSNSIRF